MDFSSIDSRAKAEALFQAGKLQKLLLMPAEFGGQDNSMNTLFVPAAAAKQKSEIDLQIIRPLAQAGRIAQYTANATYQGKSTVPNAIAIKVSEPEQFQFTIEIWGEACEGAERRWNEVYDAREAIYQEYFGPISGDVQKLMNLIGIWPGGCLVQVQAAKENLWVTSSFGLSNSDMPAHARPENYSVVETREGNVQSMGTIVSRPPQSMPKGRAGYGYEILLLTRTPSRWPLMFLNWAVPMEILKDVDLLGRVRKYGALTIESIDLGDGRQSDFMIAPPVALMPPKIDLPNGSMEFLVATAISRQEMEFGVKNGVRALLEQMKSKGDQQISNLED